MASSSDKLTPLQRALLDAFFRQEQRFFLTGGAALAGFHLQHRTTLDLDLFTDDVDLPAGVTADELRQFVGDLVVRLRRAAFPGGSGK